MTDEDIPIKSNFQTEYRKLTTKRIGFIAVCAVACLLLSIYAATVGSYPISSGDVFNSILDAILGRTPEDYGIYHIVVNLRMPAIVTALVCGFGLAIAGVCMQSMLKNPLADPYTM